MSQHPGTSTSAFPNVELSVFELWNLLWTRRLLFFVITVVFTLLALIFAFLLPPIFTAKVTLLPRQQDGERGLIGQIASLTGVSIGQESAWESLYGEILHSESLLQELLAQKWTLPGSSDQQTLQKILRPDVNADTPEDASRAAFRLREYLRSEVVKFSRDQTTGYMEIKVSMERRPVLAAEVANFLAAQLDSFLLASQRSRASEQRRFIEGRLVEVRGELKQAEDSLTEFLRNNRSYSTSPELLQLHAELSRDVEVHNAIWVELRRQLEIAKIDEQREAMSIEILDLAQPPPVRSAPRRTVICLLGMMLGMAAASVWIVIKRNNQYHPEPRSP